MAGMFGADNNAKAMMQDLEDVASMYSQAKPASDDGIMKAPKGDQIDAGSWWAWLSGATRQKAKENIARVQEELSKMNVDFSGTSPQYQQELLDGILQARQYRKDWGITESLSDKPKLLEQQGDFPMPEQSEVTTEELPPMDEEASLESRLSNIRYVRSDNDGTIDVSPAAEAADQQGIMTKPKATPVATTTTDYTPPDDATQRLLDRIAFGEGADPVKLKAQEKHGIGTTPYDMVYNYGNTLAPSKPVTQMTMQELYDYQTKLIAATKGKIPGTNQGTSAAGKYQVIRKSLFGKNGTPDKPMKNSWADKLGLKADTVYTPEIQEKIGMLALKEAGYNSYIRGKRSRNSFHNKIANIWASVARSDGSDTYGQGIHTVLSDLQPMYDDLKPIKPAKRETSPRPMLRPTK